jgi:hypothetical protein
VALLEHVEVVVVVERVEDVAPEVLYADLVAVVGDCEFACDALLEGRDRVGCCERACACVLRRQVSRGVA